MNGLFGNDRKSQQSELKQIRSLEFPTSPCRNKRMQGDQQDTPLFFWMQFFVVLFGSLYIVLTSVRVGLFKTYYE